ncbi:hypothetical protein NDU88_004848 [Pleurodeles waltl]|uniref:Uncharacterized protein n=1 Tax=Pleurodeles waltl TaxID=8319 RepID=A0AAV7V4Q6_PLEWA|nr:hypothetical protein NDU88_004848 [Pleurodeles waltl]
MEPSKVVQALKILQDEGREDLIKEGVLEEAWVGLRRAKRLSSRGVSAAVIACSSSPQKCKKLKSKSAEGRKVTRSPDQLGETSRMVQGSPVWIARKRGAGRSSRRSGGSLARRVAAGGRGAGLLSAEAVMERQRAQRESVRVGGAGHSKRAVQAQSPHESVGRQAAILKERELGGTPKMAAPIKKVTNLPVSSHLKRNAAELAASVPIETSKDVIVISDEDQEVGEAFGLDFSEVELQSDSQFDAWQRDVEEVGAGCGAPRFQGGLKGLTVHREAGRPSDGQSLPVKARAPLAHRKEERVKSGAAYLTARESAMSQMGHGAGSLEEVPSTSRGATGRWESQEEEELDFEEATGSSGFFGCGYRSYAIGVGGGPGRSLCKSSSGFRGSLP